MSNFWLNRPTFVAGGTNLVGSWWARKLLEASVETFCRVRDWIPQSELIRTDLIEKVKVVRGDISELTGSDLQADILSKVNSNILHQYLEAEKARSELGWKLLFNLQESLTRTVTCCRVFFGVKQ